MKTGDHGYFPFRLSKHAARRWVDRFPGHYPGAAYLRAAYLEAGPDDEHRLYDAVSGVVFCLRFDRGVWVVTTVFSLKSWATRPPGAPAGAAVSP